jgi:hypothetical protein
MWMLELLAATSGWATQQQHHPKGAFVIWLVGMWDDNLCSVPVARNPVLFLCLYILPFHCPCCFLFPPRTFAQKLFEK